MKKLAIPKNKKVSKTTLKRKADTLFSKSVRSLGYCQLAGKDKIHCGGVLQTMHIITRANLRLRWDKMNVLCGCAGHHVYYTHNPSAFNNLVSIHFPDKWWYVKEQEHEIAQVDYLQLIQELEKAV